MSKKYKIVNCHPAIFRAYDIRGLVDEQLNEDVYFTIACAFACILKKRGRHQAVIAWDGRLTSLDYANALEQGLVLNGIEVTRLGLVPTALMYYATSKFDIDTGLMVTGSHNPKEYNGLKIVLAGQTARQEEIQTIFEEIQRLQPTQTYPFVSHDTKQVDILGPYVEEIVGDIQLVRPLKIVVDYGHGAGAVIGNELLKRIGCEVISLFDTVDGTFPAHHPDPTIPKNLVDLQNVLKVSDADIGLAFDGDADRLGVVAPDGEIIWPDRLMLILARDVLKRKPGSTIVYDVKCSKQLKDEILDAGGRAMMSPTGHSLVKKIMRDEEAELAGEMSGHIFFKDRWYGFDDGIYSACRFLEILSQFSSMKNLLETLPSTPFSTPEIKIDIAEDKKFQFMHTFANQAQFENASLITIDGLRLEFEFGWGLLRASNTSPCLVSRFEATSEENLLSIQKLFKDQILKIDPSLLIPF